MTSQGQNELKLSFHSGRQPAVQCPRSNHVATTAIFVYQWFSLRFRGFMRSYDKTSYWLLKRGTLQSPCNVLLSLDLRLYVIERSIRVSSHEPSQNSLTFPWHFPDHFVVFPDHETYYRHFITALTLILQVIWQITHQKWPLRNNIN